MTKRLLLLFACLLMAVGMSAQKRVSGHVSDSDGNPLVNAAVRVVGTNELAYTDADGNYTLSNVPASAKQVTISYLGMESQTVDIAAAGNVVLKETQLGEAVVVGYGSAKKLGTVVGTVSKVTSEQIENKPVTTALDALQGKVAGVQIYNNTGDVGDVSGTSTTIRGVGSLNGGNTPLYVVDGQPVDASVFYMMNMNDIDSYTVLRDASATSIYGSRAANGVIFVTTKKGHRNEKAVVKVGQSIGWTQLAKSLGDPMNATQLLDYQFRNGVIDGDTYAYYKSTGVNTNWQDYYYRKSAPMYNTNFSIAGGSEATRYYISAAYLKKSGLTQYSKFKRYNLRSNLETQATKWLRAGLNLGLNYDERASDYMQQNEGIYVSQSGSQGTLLMQPYYNPYNEDGTKTDKIPGYSTYSPDIYNKYWKSYANDARLTGSAFLEITPFKGFTFKSQLGADLYDTRSTGYRLPSAPFASNSTSGWRRESFYRGSDWIITNTAEYVWEVAEGHELTFLLGQEGRKIDYNYFTSYATGMSDDRLTEISSGTDVTISNLASTHTKEESLSWFGRLDYNMLNKYFFNFTVRNDKSSKFGSNNRSATFFSGGVMWNAKAEKFLADTWWLNDLRVKFNVGSTGNSAGIGRYDALATVGTGLYNGATSWGLSSPGNKDLGWETQIQTTLGFNARIFDRVNFEMNFYNRLTKDMLMDVPVPYTTGFSSQTLNIGSMLNRGIEIMFDVDAVKNWNGLNVNVYGNFTYNKNKIKELFYGLDYYNLPDYLIAYVVDQSVNFFMPVSAGVDPETGEQLYYVPDEEGQLTDEITSSYSDDLYANTGKKRYAPINGGFGLRANWKGLTLNVDFAYVLGKWMIDNMEYFTMNSNFATYNQSRRMLDQWEKPGDVTDIPKFGSTRHFDTSLLHNSSFLRLKNLSLSYDLPESILAPTGFIKGVRLMAIARNLFTVTKWKGADPEYDSNLTISGVVPNSREYSLGIEVTF